MLMATLEARIREMLPFYRTCGYRLGSHAKAVAYTATLLSLKEWSKSARRHNRRIWQLPLTGLLHDAGYASPEYQSLLSESCIEGLEPSYEKAWLLGSLVLSIASCKIGVLPLRRALGDAARVLALIGVREPWIVDRYLSRINIDKIVYQVEVIAGYASFLIKHSPRELGIPLQLAEAFMYNVRSSRKLSRCAERTLGSRGYYDEPVYLLFKATRLADLIVSDLENKGFNPDKIDKRVIRELSTHLPMNEPDSLIRYISMNIRRYYKALSHRSGAAC